MTSLSELSSLYKKLSDKFDNNKGNDITLEFFGECVEIAAKSDPTEIRFIQFSLKILYDDVDTGIDIIDSIVNRVYKGLKTITKRNIKVLFINAVLEAALEKSKS